MINTRYTFLMMTKLSFLILALLAAAFALYGLMVLMTASGTLFFLVWFAAAAAAAAYAAALGSGLWPKLSLPLRLALTLPVLAGVIAVLILSAVIMGFAAGHRSIPEDTAPRYLIVLGAQVRKSGPSLVLKYRLDKAADCLKAYPGLICVVSGGKGGNEPFSEAEGMHRYLESKGIDPDRILTEDRSLNTVQNLQFSRAVMTPEMSEIGTIVLVTNDFHLFRASHIAAAQGFSDVIPLAAGSSPLYLPNNLLRECLGLVKDFLFGNLSF